MDEFVGVGVQDDLRSRRGTPLEDGMIQSVLVTMDRAAMDNTIPEIQGWFAERDEVEIVFFGTTDKQAVGCIMIEWHGYEIDPLFLTILEQNEEVFDFVVYTRNEGE